MIDFRYHLVSIVAVFLALGLGILLGATAIKPLVLSGLESTAHKEQKRIAQLYVAQDQKNNQITSDEKFAAAAEPQLLHGLLAGQRVVLVEAPGADSGVVSGIIGAVSQAGATVSGQVQMQSQFFDGSTSTQSALATLAQQLTPVGTAPPQGSPLQQASQVLAGAILTHNAPGQPVAGQRDATSQAVLSGFAAGSFLTDSGDPATRATLAVVVIPATPLSTNDSNPQSQAMVTLAQALDRAGLGAVVAGPSGGSGPGSAIDVMRTAGRAGRMSSVDDADTVIGQIVVAQALAERLRGISGSYGSAASAAAAGPSPAPTPSPTPSAAAVSSSAAHRGRA